MTADNQTKHPPPERPLPFWWRIPLGLACWALVSRLLFVLLVQPPKQAPDEFFHICVLQDGQPTFARFSDAGSWRGKALCREPVRFAANPDKGWDGIIDTDGRMVYAQKFTGGFSDPWEFAYRIGDAAEPSVPVPLWQRHGAHAAQAWAVFLAALPAFVLQRLLVFWIYRRRHGREKKQPQ